MAQQQFDEAEQLARKHQLEPEVSPFLSPLSLSPLCLPLVTHFCHTGSATEEGSCFEHTALCG